MTWKDSSAKPSRLIFVYGTLKRGFCRNYFLADSLLISETKTRPNYLMYDCGEFPGIVPVDPGSGMSICGEVWAVDDLDIEQLDVVEAVEEGLYRRVFLQLADTFDAPVEGYLYNRSIEGLPDCGDNWTKGFQS